MMKPILHPPLEGPVKSLFGGGGGGGGGTQTSQPTDMTPGAFKGMRGDIAEQFKNLFASGGGAEYQGPMAAGVTGDEQNILQQLMGASQPSQATQAGQNFMQQLMAGPAGSTVQGGTSMEQANPFLQQAIEAAQRPLIDQYTDQIAPALRAQFTNAGQQIQGQGSSPFHMAAAREQVGMANALGDISSQMSAQDWAQRQGLSSQEFQQERQLEMQGRQQQLDAVATSANVDRQQLDGLLANLEAQALPRLVEQLGIDRGLEEFRRREEQLLQALQTAGALASPTVGQVQVGNTGSTSGQNPNFGPAIGSMIGAMFSSSRDYKENIKPADEAALDEAVRGLTLHNYTYRPGMGIDGAFVSPMAEEVPDVFRGPDGKTINLYNMVSGLVASSHAKDRQIVALEARLVALENGHDAK